MFANTFVEWVPIIVFLLIIAFKLGHSTVINCDKNQTAAVLICYSKATRNVIGLINNQFVPST